MKSNSIKILSNREYETWPSWHIVFEWEDEISATLNLPIVSSKKLHSLYENKIIRKVLSNKTIKGIVQKIDRIFYTRKNLFLTFEMTPKANYSYSNRVNSIPIIIDFYKTRNLEFFYNTYKNCSLVCVTSIEVYNFLKQNKCPLKLLHLPLSLPSMYKSNLIYSEKKKYDLIIAGRRNAILWNFLQQFEKKFPNIEYLYHGDQKKGEFYYISNKTGKVGNFDTRESYFQILKNCKVSFYTTPGIDGGEKRTGGFNQVTPRLFELLSCGCFVMGRYPDNEETAFFNLKEFCPNINSYEEFETILLGYLDAKSPDLKLYEAYLENHYTYNRALQLKSYLDSQAK